jgi:hypothetical protein
MTYPNNVGVPPVGDTVSGLSVKAPATIVEPAPFFLRAFFVASSAKATAFCVSTSVFSAGGGGGGGAGGM